MIKIDKSLIKGSFFLLIIFNIYSFFNFLFQSSMAHFLTIIEYGILAALFYVVYFLSIFSESIQTIIIKYASREDNEGKVKNIINKAMRKSSLLAIFLFFLYLIIALPFSFILKIPYLLLSITGLIIFPTFFLPITRGVMLAKRKFFSLGASLMVESIVKLALAVLFVWLGWKVYGAMAAVLIGLVIAFFVSYFMLHDIISVQEKKAETIGIYTYSKPIFIMLFTLLAFYTSDILIAQIVFTKEIAGYYAIASVLSKIIFWGTQPISRALFPLSAQESLNNIDKRKSSYGNALVLLLIGIMLILLIFFFFSNEIIILFSGKEIAESANILFYLGIATSFLSLANLNILYKASQGKVHNAFIFVVFMILGISLLLFFNDSLIEYSLAFVTASAIYLWASIVIIKT